MGDHPFVNTTTHSLSDSGGNCRKMSLISFDSKDYDNESFKLFRDHLKHGNHKSPYKK